VTAIFELRDVSAAYGPFRALFGVSLTIERGEAVALVGPNGAGKTTVARVASGLVPPTAGAVVVDGVDLTRSRPYEFARAGVAHAPEGRSIFSTLTVEENLTLSFRRARGRRNVRSGLDLAFDLFPPLERRRKQSAGNLSGGEQRMLSMARVLVEAPKVLIADELSLGLAPIVIEQTYESLHKLRESGTSLLIVEQHVGHALRLCDRVAMLDHGTVSWTGTSEEAADRITTQLLDASR
jgi:branched-chain amino acid transport system ATP-binding protein